jgi:CheY-like chemotaxis protein
MPSVQLPKKEGLIVDDDVGARELLSEFCRGQGFEVATAHDGRAAIAAIARDPKQFAVIEDHLEPDWVVKWNTDSRPCPTPVQTINVPAMNSDVSTNPILS